MATERVETTLGDLILLLTEETKPFVNNESEACRLVAIMLGYLLADKRSLRQPIDHLPL